MTTQDFVFWVVVGVLIGWLPSLALPAIPPQVPPTTRPRCPICQSEVPPAASGAVVAAQE